MWSYGNTGNADYRVFYGIDWYIVYHRISRPNGVTNTDPGPGNVRELCIDVLSFNTDGTIQAVIPTLKGIQPVSIPAWPTDLNSIVVGAERGALISVAIFDVSGVKLRINQPLKPGIYIVQRIFESGRVEFRKEMLDGYQHHELKEPDSFSALLIEIYSFNDHFINNFAALIVVFIFRAGEYKFL